MDCCEIHLAAAPYEQWDKPSINRCWTPSKVSQYGSPGPRIAGCHFQVVLSFLTTGLVSFLRVQCPEGNQPPEGPPTRDVAGFQTSSLAHWPRLKMGKSFFGALFYSAPRPPQLGSPQRKSPGLGHSPGGWEKKYRFRLGGFLLPWLSPVRIPGAPKCNP